MRLVVPKTLRRASTTPPLSLAFIGHVAQECHVVPTCTSINPVHHPPKSETYILAQPLLDRLVVLGGVDEVVEFLPVPGLPFRNGGIEASRRRVGGELGVNRTEFATVGRHATSDLAESLVHPDLGTTRG